MTAPAFAFARRVSTCAARGGEDGAATVYPRFSLVRQKPPTCGGFLEAAGLGFEPRLPGPEPGVLPLDDPATAGAL
jgi:hypothetical protein